MSFRRRFRAELVKTMILEGVAVLFAVVGIVVFSIANQLRGGMVVDRRFVPAHDEQYQSYEVWYYHDECRSVPDYDGKGTHQDCQMEPVYHFVERTRHVADAWSVLIEGRCGQNGDEHRCDQRWLSVTHLEYDGAELGTWYGPTEPPK